MKILKILEKILLLSVVFLLPFFVLPIFPNLYYPAKLALLVFGMGAWLIIRAVRSTSEGKLEFTRGKFDLAVIIFTLAYLVGAAVATPNKMEAFFLPGTATIVAVSALLYFALGEVEPKLIKGTLLASGVILAIVSLLTASGITRSLPLPEFAKTEGFNFIGGTLPLSMFLAVLLPLSLGWTFSTKETVNKVFLGVVSFLLAFGLAVSIYGNIIVSKSRAVFQDLTTSWSVTVDTLKESPILGAGPANYLTAFNRFRPIGYNQTALWDTRFNSGHDFYLTTIAETGLIGLAALVILLTQVVKELSSYQTNKKVEVLSLGLLLLVGFFFPFSPVAITLLFILLSLGSGNRTAKNIYPRFPILLITLPIIALAVFVGYLATGYLTAEAYFNNSLTALRLNDGKKTYEEVGLAVKTNPFVDRYHITRSQVALALANALAGQKDLTEEEKNSVAQLIQQSIAEAKAAVTLNPTRAANWELLGKNYQAIISFAKGSDQFAVQTYSQAIALDPINPILRIELGGVYYAQGNYDLAIDTFKLAVLAKADYANSHYNLAIALREKKEYTQAIEEMKVVLSLVNKDSKDYELARAELESLEKKKASTKETAGTETLTQPEKQTQTNPQVELPSDSTPPQAPEGVPTPVPAQ